MADKTAGRGDADFAASTELAPGTEPTLVPTAEHSSDFADLPSIDPDNYTIGVEVARGGMGKIMIARDRRLRREVALKVLLTKSGANVRRFEREALITARLQHPSIVRVYEAGRWPDGQPFYAMEKVRGESLDAVIRRAQGFDRRLALLPHVIAVAEALAYAHSEGIVHRDLKPANVLVGSFGETVVIDWGLAKDLRAVESSSDETAQPVSPTAKPTDLTVAGSIMGTPAYMAPEQARGEAVDERTDVYAIGTLLYCTLAGRPPYRGTSSDDVLSRVSAGSATPIDGYVRGVPPELLTILARCMAPQPVDRYASALELAADLRAFETGQLVSAHRYSFPILAWRWTRRHRVAVGTAVTSIAILTAMSVIGIRRVVHERDRAAEQSTIAEGARSDAEASRRRAILRADEMILRQARGYLRSDPSTTLAWLKELSPAREMLHNAHILARQAQLAGVAHQLDGHTDDVEHLYIGHHGQRAVSGSDDHTVRVWDLQTRTSRKLSSHGGPVEALALSPDGRWVVSGSTDHTVRVWDMMNGTEQVFAKHAGTIEGLAISANSEWFVSGSADHTVRRWDLRRGTSKLLARHADGVRPVAITPDGTLVISGSGDGAIGIWDSTTGRGRTYRGHAAELRTLAVSPNGKSFVSGAEDGHVRLWSTAGVLIRRLGSHTDLVREVLYSPDGAHVISAGGDHVVRVYVAATGKTHTLEGNQSGIKDIAVSRDGRLVASAGIDRTVHVWPLLGGPARVLRGHAGSVKAVAFSPDAAVVVSTSDDDKVRVWSLRPGAPPPTGESLRGWLTRATNLRTTR